MTNLAKETSQVDKPLSRKDYQTDLEVRWCPGCGDYAILAQFQKLLAAIGARKAEHVVVSGIGCSSRFPYYIDTYGLHGIHGRAPAVATGLKAVNPDLTVWVVTGDGDGLSIGGNQLLHALRRNVDIKILLFNNEVYGLTKGQHSPTSPEGQRSRSNPDGNTDRPVDPVSLALAAGATLVARAVDTDAAHLQGVLRAAADHRGAAFVEILQNCPIFNDTPFEAMKFEDRRLYLEDGAPMLFGDQALSLDRDTLTLRAASTAETAEPLVHDRRSKALARVLAEAADPSLPTPLGVLYAEDRPVHHELMRAQVQPRESGGLGRLQDRLASGPTWRVS
ncbi:MAG: 2-oxoacid:ferredoxin oxidoreductase subunit beta [Gammaproteobacteria bacterium]|nr:2-oxoacid:ferredoxin oxidoreductase subunit beta [Gammaproteobacteria bacterium]